MTSVSGNFGTLGAMSITTSVGEVEGDLEALGEFLVEYFAVNNLTGVQLMILLDPAVDTEVAH